MRKHSIRKILHGLLDLLPLFVIPVFMVYSHRHAIDSYSVSRTEYEKVFVQQLVVNGEPTSLNTWTYDNVEFENDKFLVITTGNCATDVDVVFNNKYLVKCSVKLTYDDDSYVSITCGNFDDVFNGSLEGLTTSYIFINNDIDASSLDVYCEVFNYSDYYFYNVQLFDLTAMFGSGNEPTIEEFNAMFPNEYYSYDSNAYTFVPVTRTYNATDIGSQFIYSMYNVTENYFNTDSVFGLGNLHTWISNNFFNGNMPLGVTVVYHIIVYELIMDIIFLIYAVFMFIVDFASDFLEHCFSWSRKGGA